MIKHVDPSWDAVKNWYEEHGFWDAARAPEGSEDEMAEIKRAWRGSPTQCMAAIGRAKADLKDVGRALADKNIVLQGVW